MTNPTFENKLTRYLFTWPDYQLQAEVSRIHLHSDGRLTCNLLFNTTNPEYNNHLLQTSFNLSSSRSRTDLKKDLTAQYKEPVNWDEVIEFLSVKSTRTYETGEPVIELLSDEDIEKPEYLVYPFLPKDKPTVIFGEPASKKTDFALILSAIMSLPYTDNKLNMVAPKAVTQPLYLDWESDAVEIKWKLHGYQKGLGVGAIPLYYRRCFMPLVDDIEQIRKYIEQYNIKIVIIDSLGPACGGDLNKPEFALAFFNALRSLNVTILILAHTSKDKENKNKTIFGSMFFEAIARCIWEIRKVQDDNSNEIDIGLFHRKMNMDKLQAPRSFRITHSDDVNCTTVEITNPDSVPELVDRMSDSHKVYLTIKEAHDGIDNKGIAEFSGIDSDKVGVYVGRLNKKGLIQKVAGLWHLVADKRYDELIKSSPHNNQK